MNKNSKLEENKYCTGGREPTRKRGTKVGEWVRHGSGM
jgi:hypothetical protein